MVAFGGRDSLPPFNCPKTSAANLRQRPIDTLLDWPILSSDERGEVEPCRRTVALVAPL
jgi:hypothetical protein